MTIDVEVLTALKAFPAGLSRKDLFPLCDSVLDEVKLGSELKRLRDEGAIVIASERRGNVGATYVATEAGLALLDSGDTGLSFGDVIAVAKSELTAAIDSFVEGVANPFGCSKNTSLVQDGDKSTKDDAELTGELDKAHQLGEIDHFAAIEQSLAALKAKVNQPSRVIDDLDVKIKCLNKLAQLFNQDVAEVLYAVIADLESI